MNWCPQSAVSETMMSDLLVHCCIAIRPLTLDPERPARALNSGLSILEKRASAVEH
jgi:hypothetical protein